VEENWACILHPCDGGKHKVGSQSMLALAKSKTLSLKSLELKGLEEWLKG
jgi:hypothetical protein